MISIELQSNEEPQQTAIISSLKTALETSQWNIAATQWAALFSSLAQLTPDNWEKLLPMLPLWTDWLLKSATDKTEAKAEIERFYKMLLADTSKIPLALLVRLYLEVGKSHLKVQANSTALLYFSEIFGLAKHLPVDEMAEPIEHASYHIDNIEAQVFQFMEELSEPMWRKDKEQLAVLRQRWQLHKTCNAKHLAWLQKSFTDEIVKFIAQMASFVQVHLQEPPCAFAWIGLGSISRGEMYPYSDLDCALLVADENCRNHSYFAEMIRLFQWKINLLGEPRGLRIDSGDMGHFLSQEKHLVNTPQGLFHYANPEKIQKPDEYAQPELYSLHRPLLLMASSGGEHLLSAYQKLINESLLQHYLLSSTSSPHSSRNNWKKRVLNYSQRGSGFGSLSATSYPLYRMTSIGYLWMHRQQWEKIKFYWSASNHEHVNIKERYLSPLIYGCVDLALYYGFFNEQQSLSTSITEILNQLADQKKLSEASVHLLHQAWEFLQSLRIKLHMKAEYQNDKPLKPATKNASASSYMLSENEEYQLRYIEEVVLTAFYSSIEVWQVAAEPELVDLPMSALEHELAAATLSLHPSHRGAMPLRLQAAIRMLTWYLVENKLVSENHIYWKKLPSIFLVQAYYIEQLLHYYQRCNQPVIIDDYFKQTPLLLLLQEHLNPALTVDKDAIEAIFFLAETLGHYPVSPALYRYYLHHMPANWRSHFIEQVERWIENQRKANLTATGLERWNYILTPLYAYPKSDGRRLSMEISAQAWFEAIEILFVTAPPTSGVTVKITRLPQRLQDNIKPEIQTGWLQPAIVQSLIAQDGYFKEDQRATRSGRHNVIAIRWNKYAFHFKQQPELPGLEYAIGRFNQYLIGYGSPQVELVRFEIKIGKNTVSYPVLISETVSGNDLYSVLKDYPERLKNLDAKHYSQLILASLLTNPEDGKPDNYILNTFFQGDRTPYGRIIGIDNDHAFVEPLTKNATGQPQVHIKTILYCLDNMLSPVHPEAVEEILILEPGRMLLNWLVELKRQHEAYLHLFSPQEIKRWYQDKRIKALLSDSESPIVIGIYLKETLIKDIYQKMLLLQEALRENSQLSHLALLNQVDARLGKFYESELNYPDKSPLERFHVLTKSQYSSIMAGRLGTLANSRQILKSALQEVPKFKSLLKEEKYHPKQALLALRNIREQENQWQAARDALLQGKVELFQALSTDTLKEQVISKLQFTELTSANGAIDIELQKKILEAIKQTPFRRLSLSHCTALTDERLKGLLRNSRSLTELNISYCTKVTHAIIPFLAKYCPNLEKLELMGLSWSKLILEKLPKLRRLTISHCAQLSAVYSDSSHLYWLKANGCALLSNVQAPQATLQFASLASCPNFAFAAIKEKHPQLIQPSWPLKVIAALAESCVDEQGLSEASTLNLSNLAIETAVLNQLMVLIGDKPQVREVNLENNQLDDNSVDVLSKIIQTYPNLSTLNIKRNLISKKYLFRLQEMADKVNEESAEKLIALQLLCDLDESKPILSSDYQYTQRGLLQLPLAKDLLEQSLTQQVLKTFIALPSEEGIKLPVSPYQKLQTLNFSNRPLNYIQVQALVRGVPQLTQLNNLNLWQSGLDKTDIALLAKGLASLSTLRTLNLGSNNLSAGEMEGLAACWPHLSQLTDLNLSQNQLKRRGLRLLLSALQPLKQLMVLNIACNSLYGEECELLGELCKITQLISLDLSGNKLGFRRSQGLDSIKQYMYMRQDHPSTHQVALLDNFSCSNHLIYLNLERCGFNQIAMTKLMSKLKDLRSLATLKMLGNYVKNNLAALSCLSNLTCLSIGLNKEKLLQSMKSYYVEESFISNKDGALNNLNANSFLTEEELASLTQSLTYLTALKSLTIEGLFGQEYSMTPDTYSMQLDEFNNSLSKFQHLTHLDICDAFLTARIIKWDISSLRNISMLSLNASSTNFEKLKELTWLTTLSLTNIQLIAKKIRLAEVLKCLSRLNVLHLQTIDGFSIIPIKVDQITDICHSLIYLPQLTTLSLKYVDEAGIKLIEEKLSQLTSLIQINLEPKKCISNAMSSKIEISLKEHREAIVCHIINSNNIKQLYHSFLSQAALDPVQILKYLDSVNQQVSQQFYMDSLFCYHYLFDEIRRSTVWDKTCYSQSIYLTAKAYHATLIEVLHTTCTQLHYQALLTEECKKIFAHINQGTESIEVEFQYLSPAHGLLFWTMVMISDSPIFSIQSLNNKHMDTCSSLSLLLSESIKNSHVLNRLSLNEPSWTRQALNQLSEAVMVNDSLKCVELSNGKEEVSKLLSNEYFEKKDSCQIQVLAQTRSMQQEINHFKQVITEQINNHMVLLEKSDQDMNYSIALQLLDSDYCSLRTRAVNYLNQNQRWKTLMLEHFAQGIRILPPEMQPFLENAIRMLTNGAQKKIPVPSLFWDNYPSEDKISELLQSSRNKYFIAIKILLTFRSYLEEVEEAYLTFFNEMLLQCISELIHVSRCCEYIIPMPLIGESEPQSAKQHTTGKVMSQPARAVWRASARPSSLSAVSTLWKQAPNNQEGEKKVKSGSYIGGRPQSGSLS